ncbi:MAG: 4-(cytidine 5'-diphospho)-2-C-methyl-D-erythritol kinase [Bdellovibrionales bacterium]
MNSPPALTVFAPAKINLYLHVIARLQNGYHALDSLIAFTDIGDDIRITPAQSLQFSVEGPFASGFRPSELSAEPSSSNLVVKAVWRLAKLYHRSPDIHIHLTKNLPLGAGIGGGSSDAAAVIWGLLTFWGLPKDDPALMPLLTQLGADVPVCFSCETARIRGIGDILDPVPDIPETPFVLIYPGAPCPTADVFMRFGGAFSTAVTLPDDWDHMHGFLQRQRNDLRDAALEIVPDIRNALNMLETASGCSLARLSGSGSSCFGLFDTEDHAHEAAKDIAAENPDWWVKAGWIGRTQRY